MNISDYYNLLLNDPSELFAKALELRKRYYSNNVSFSYNIFVPVTRQCRNNCRYCGFSSPSPHSWVGIQDYTSLLSDALKLNAPEILLTLGEKPEQRYKSARDFLSSLGFSSTVEYLHLLAKMAVDLHLLPHTNAGVLSHDELNFLRPYNASMGLMLETTSERLLHKSFAHERSIGKVPAVRIKTITDAGSLHIPFTTGLLIGIGETWLDRIYSLMKIREISIKYKHIQEVIIQNFSPIPHTPMADFPPPTEMEFLYSVALARVILPPSVSVQVPPNLNEQRIIKALNAGANDLGGISPLTIDFVNPFHPWPRKNFLREALAKHGFRLTQRLPVYPKYVKYLNTELKRIALDRYREIQENESKIGF